MKRSAKAPKLAELGLRLFVRIAASVAIVFTSIWLARATEGGATRSELTFSGTLNTAAGAPLAGPVGLTFAFKQDGATVCEVQVPGVTPDPTNGAFDAPVPLAGCPTTLFDGTDTTLELSVNGGGAVLTQPVSPTPYAKYADYSGTPDCPLGYEVLPPPSGTSYIVCKRGYDEVVRVGRGSTAFWIDRYEASVWSEPAGTGTQYGVGADDYLATFPDNGAYTSPLYAVSRVGVRASGALTWPQMVAACEASGKRLMNTDEFFAAARGTIDPGVNDGVDGSCATSGEKVFFTGAHSRCRSTWGAEDLIGSLYEPMADWILGVGSGVESFSNWPSDFASDRTYNIVSMGSYGDPVVEYSGLPLAVFRGGTDYHGTIAGIFMQGTSSLAHGFSAQGVRCVIPR